MIQLFAAAWMLFLFGCVIYYPFVKLDEKRRDKR